MLKRLPTLVTMMAAMSAIAAPAFAQLAQPTLRTGRPTRGLFGGGTGETEQQLVLNLSLGGGHDRDTSAQATVLDGTSTAVTPPWSGSYGTGAAGLSYSLARERITASAGVGINAHHKPGRGIRRATGVNGSVSAQLSSRSSISASGGVSLQPHNFQLLFGSWFDSESVANPLMDLSGATAEGNRFSTQGALTYTHTLTRRINLYAGYTFVKFNGWDNSPATASRTHEGSTGVTYQIFRGARLRVGYRYASSRIGAGPAIEYGGLGVDGGLSFDRAISLSRRTKFTFGTGVTGARDERSKTYYFLTGHAGLSHEIGRSWTAAANYRRSVDFSQGLGLPVILDTTSIGVRGIIGRRMQFSAGGGGAWGTLGISAGSRNFSIASGNVSLQTAISRTLATTVMYAYRQYHFDNPGALPAGIQSERERHSVRVTLDAWVPLIIRTRSANASR